MDNNSQNRVTNEVIRTKHAYFSKCQRCIKEMRERERGESEKERGREREGERGRETEEIILLRPLRNDFGLWTAVASPFV